MKRIIQSWLCLLVMFFALTACGQEASPWQEQYDLGIRYLSDGNYEEAILAFNAAIKIDPKNPEAYIGRGRGYILWNPSEENMRTAMEDYATAAELGSVVQEHWIELAELAAEHGADRVFLEEILTAAQTAIGNTEEMEEFRTAIEEAVGVTREVIDEYQSQMPETQEASYQMVRTSYEASNNNQEFSMDVFCQEPKLLGDSPATRKINEYFKMHGDGFIQSEDVTEAINAAANESQINSCWIFRDCTVVNNSNGIFSVMYSWQQRLSGATIGKTSCVTFDLNTGEELTIYDIVPVAETGLLDMIQTRLHWFYMRSDWSYWLDEGKARIQSTTLEDLNFFVKDGEVYINQNRTWRPFLLAHSESVATGLRADKPYGDFHSEQLDRFRTSEGDLAFGSVEFFANGDFIETAIQELTLYPDGTCHYWDGIYYGEYMDSMSGSYTLEGDILDLSLTLDYDEQNLNCRYRLIPVGEGIIFEQLSERGIYKKHKLGTGLYCMTQDEFNSVR